MRKVIITGATGFIGGALAKKLLSTGVKVYGIGRNKKRLEEMKQYGDFVGIFADFSQYDKLSELIQERDFDAFYHFAWANFFGEALKNYKLQLNSAKVTCDAISQAIELKCKKFVFAGTANQIEITNLLTDEINNPRYTHIYSSSKTVAEIICKTLAYNNGIEYSAGLIAMAYGENNWSLILPNVVIKQLLKKESPKLIEGNNLYDMIYIDDIVEAFIAIGEKGKNMKSYYVGHRKLKTFKEIITQIGQIIDPNVVLKFGEYPETDNKDYSLTDLDALYDDTGFECKADFRESILKTAEWIKTHNL